MATQMTNQMNEQMTDLIFVSIASYRDSDLPNTVRDLFLKAKHPDRIRVGICQQINEATDINIETHLKNYPRASQIKVITTHYADAKGPTHARELVRHLYDDELFVLQIDSHTRFVHNWDEVAIQELLECPSDKPVLSTFPGDFTPSKPLNLKQPITYLAMLKYHERTGFPQSHRLGYRRPPLAAPHRTALWSAGLSFTLGSCYTQVPYQADLPYLFLGEEISMAVRMYTFGWDLFTPTCHIVFHNTDRAYRPTYWENFYKTKQHNRSVTDAQRLERKQMEQESIKLVQDMLSGKDDTYIGNIRSLQDYETFSGISLHGDGKCSANAKKGLFGFFESEESNSKAR